MSILHCICELLDPKLRKLNEAFFEKKPNPYIIAEIGINHNGYLKLLNN